MGEFSVPALVLAAIFVFAILIRLSALEKRVAKVASLERKIDALLIHAGIEYDPYENLPDDVVEALRRGEKIQAIKHYSAATGAGLKEAKEFVEEVQSRMGLRA